MSFPSQENPFGEIPYLPLRAHDYEGRRFLAALHTVIMIGGEVTVAVSGKPTISLKLPNARELPT